MSLQKYLREMKSLDPHNQTAAILLLVSLAQLSKDYRKVRAYTFWNLIATITNVGFKLRWEKVIACNSLGILVCYKTAELDCKDQLMKNSGLSPAAYALGDFLFHVLPFFIVGRQLVQEKKRLRPQHGAFSLLGQFFFAYSQVGEYNTTSNVELCLPSSFIQ